MAEKLTLEQRVEKLEHRLNSSTIKHKTELDVKREQLQELYNRRGIAKSNIDEKSDWNKSREVKISEYDYVRELILHKQSELKTLEISEKPEKILITNTNMGGI
jgi:hypothetical protein